MVRSLNRGQLQFHTGELKLNFQTTMENNTFYTVEKTFIGKHHTIFLHSIQKLYISINQNACNVAKAKRQLIITYF